MTLKQLKVYDKPSGNLAANKFGCKHTGYAAIENALDNRQTRIKIAITVFLIIICRQSGEKWLSKTLFLAIFDLRSSIV